MSPLRCLLGGLVLPGALVCARAGDAPHALPAAPAGLTIGAARAASQDRQPAVAAARATLHAAMTRRDAIHALRVPTFVARDLPLRKQQSELGVAAADAGLRLAQMNASYAAAYSYLSYLYALEQERVADDAVANLTKLREKFLTPDEDEAAAKRRLVREGDDEEKKPEKKIEEKEKKAPSGKLTDPNTLSPEKWIEYLSIETYLGVARTRREEAAAGSHRALSALREAMGLPPDAPLSLLRGRLPDVCLTLDKSILLTLAAERRPEIAQAVLGLEVTSLEAEAQAKTSFLAFRVNTFASGSDLHATPLPAGTYDSEYKPGAVGPEMPAVLNGGKHGRTAQAEAWTGRASTVVDRTKLLIGLETDQSYLRWTDATKRLAGYRSAFQTAHTRVREQRRMADAKEEFNVPKILEAGAIASQMRADLNKARYEVMLGLAQLERVTAGGFCARLDDAADAPDEVAAADAVYDALQKRRKELKDEDEKAREKKEKDKDKKDDAVRLGGMPR